MVATTDGAPPAAAAAAAAPASPTELVDRLVAAVRERRLQREEAEAEQALAEALELTRAAANRNAAAAKRRPLEAAGSEAAGTRKATKTEGRQPGRDLAVLPSGVLEKWLQA